MTRTSGPPATTSEELGRRIREIRESEDLSQSELARLLGRTQASVSNWESGRRSPGLDELQSVADALGRDLHDLLPPKRRGEPVKAALRALVDQLDERTLSDELNEFLTKAEELAALDAEISVSDDNPIRVAQQLLAKAGVDQLPIDVESLANRCGVRVLPWRFADALSGLVVDLEGGPVIGVNKRHVKERQRFTIAHELAHHLLRHRDRFYVDLRTFPDAGDPPGYHPRHEKDANDLAANLLMPGATVRHERRQTRSPDRLAERFGVSSLAMRYRLANLGLR